MKKISIEKQIESALLSSDTHFYKPSIYQFFMNGIKNYKTTKEVFKDLISQADSEHAHHIIIKKDIQRIEEQVENQNNEFDDNFYKENKEKIKEKIIQYVGREFELRDSYIVKNFPKGHEGMEEKGATAITTHTKDNKEAIYFLKKKIENISTNIHLIHEQIHVCFSQNRPKDQFTLEWFEEGYVIYLSLKIYYELTKNIKTIKLYKERSKLFSKVKPEWDFGKRYYEYMKIISILFLEGGHARIQKLKEAYLNNNKEEIVKSLKQSLKNKTINYKPKDEFENFICGFGMTIEPEKITPLEYLIVKVLETGASNTKTIATSIHAPEKITEDAINRLFSKGLCIMTKEKTIDLNWKKKDLFELGLIKPVLM